MKYYLITREIAEMLNLTSFRHEAKDGRFVVNASDLAPIDINTHAFSVIEISLAEAKKIIGK